MDLDHLKKTWKEQDEKLSKGVKINQMLLKNAFTQRANGVIEKLLLWEYFSLIEFVIFLTITGVSTFKFMDDGRFLLSGIFIIIFLVVCISGSFWSITQLNSIDLFSQSIVDTRRRILLFKQRANKLFTFVLYVIPPVIVAFLVLGINLIRHINLFDHPAMFTILSVSIIVISYPAAFISHKTIYQRKLRLIEHGLNELEVLEEENA